MRATIRERLVAGVSAVQGRVFEPHAASLDTPKPFLVVREGARDAGEPWGDFSTVVEVWPYAKRESFATVDGLAASVVDTLHRARFSEGGEEFYAEHLGSTGPDFEDADWDALTRGLRFRVYALGWLSGLTYEPDPVAALRAWMRLVWPTVQTDPATWSPADTTPAIYWRLVTVTAAQVLQWGAWLEVGLRAHVLAPAPRVRLAWVRYLTEALAQTRQVPLADGSPLLFQTVAADSEADPLRVGQVRLAARLGVLRSATGWLPPGPIAPPPLPGEVTDPLNVAVAGGDVSGTVRAAIDEE